MKKRPAKAERLHSFHSSSTPFLSEAAAVLFICKVFFFCIFYKSWKFPLPSTKGVVWLTGSAGFAISVDLPFPSYREEYPIPADSVLYSFRS